MDNGYTHSCDVRFLLAWAYLGSLQRDIIRFYFCVFSVKKYAEF